MTDGHDDSDDELPPIILAPGLQIQVTGFKEELSHTVGNEIAGVVSAASRYLPLKNLIGITVAYDYASALATIDVGFDGKASPPQATHDEELGYGAAMAVTVEREGLWKTHIVFGSHIVGLLSSDKQKG